MSDERKSKYFGGAGNSFNIQIEKAEGSLLFDTDGKRYIDLLGGSCVGNLGWGNERIEKSIRQAEIPSYVSPNFYYKRWDELAELIASITPGNLEVSYRTTGGSESVDAAMQIAMLYTRRSEFLSIENAYHGNTLAALSIGASANQKTIPQLLSNCHKINLPLNDALNKIESTLKKEKIAAFIMEPVITSLGIIIPEQDFMKQVNDLCKKYGTLLIMDEVATGFGRTGKMFATEHYDIEPDIMTMAKGISAGYAAIGAVTTTETISKKVADDLNLYSTFGWHPLSVEASIATINYLLQNSETLFSNAEAISTLIKENLAEIQFQKQPEIRIKGLAVGIDFNDADYATDIKKKAIKNGLVVSTEATSVVFYPPLDIERSMVEEGLEILKKSI